MAAKKSSKAARKKAPAKKGRKAGKKAGAPTWLGGAGCTEEELCEYLTALGVWLTEFIDDYQRLRKAVCNVEKKAWGLGGATTTRRFCSHGASDEPDNPTRPPTWP